MSVPFRPEKVLELVKKLDGYIQLEKHSYRGVEFMVALGMLYVHAMSLCACDENGIRAMFDELREQAIDNWRRKKCKA